jgi:hypothetical protein
MGKKAVMTSFNVISRNTPGGTKENQDKPQSELLPEYKSES